MTRKLKRVFAVAGLTASIGCSDALAPHTDAIPPPSDTRAVGELHILRHATTYASPPGLGEYGALFETTGTPKPLEAYQADFWAVRGADRSLRIGYLDGQDFLELTVSATSLLTRPDGTPFAPNDSVLIRIAIDSSLLFVDLQPSGLRFSAETPAILDVRYGDADPDLNGDGVVDLQDQAIESNQLGLWVQQDESSPWFLNEASHSLTEKRFVGYLQHFSNYTVSW